MDNRPITSADDMPILFRVILDLVGELEGHDRATADRIRRSAIRAYSTSWDRTQHGRLEELANQLRRRIDRQVAADNTRSGRPD
jgi:class 3 adenylate cyclase